MMNVIRTRDAQSGTITPGVPGCLTASPVKSHNVKDYYDYYKTNRGFMFALSIPMVHGVLR